MQKINIKICTEYMNYYNNKHIISDVNSEDLQDIDIISKNINTKADMSLSGRREVMT
jgi:hypothetical protein